MMNLSEKLALLGSIDPSNQAAGEQLSQAIPLANHRRILGVVSAGVLQAGGVVNAQWKGSATAGGTYTAIPNTAIAPITVSGNKGETEIRPIALESLNLGYAFVKLSVVVTVAACQTAATVHGDQARYSDASFYDITALTSKTVLNV